MDLLLRKTKSYNRIDHIYVSRALADRVAGAGIERRGIANLARITKGVETSFPQVTSWRVAASDHAAVWLDIDL